MNSSLPWDSSTFPISRIDPIPRSWPDIHPDRSPWGNRPPKSWYFSRVWCIKNGMKLDDAAVRQSMATAKCAIFSSRATLARTNELFPQPEGPSKRMPRWDVSLWVTVSAKASSALSKGFLPTKSPGDAGYWYPKHSVPPRTSTISSAS